MKCKVVGHSDLERDIKNSTSGGIELHFKQYFFKKKNCFMFLNNSNELV
jgi:hypothetical protein